MGMAVTPLSQFVSENQFLFSGFGCHGNVYATPNIGHPGCECRIHRSLTLVTSTCFVSSCLQAAPSHTAPGSPRLSVATCRPRDPGFSASASTSTTERQENDEHQVSRRPQRQETGEAPDSASLSTVARERPGPSCCGRSQASCRPAPSALLGVPTPSRVPCGVAAKAVRPPPPRDCSPSPALSLSSHFGRRRAVPSGTKSSVSGEGTSVPGVSPRQGPCCAGSRTTITATERRGTAGLGVCSWPL